MAIINSRTCDGGQNPQSSFSRNILSKVYQRHISEHEAPADWVRQIKYFLFLFGTAFSSTVIHGWAVWFIQINEWTSTFMVGAFMTRTKVTTLIIFKKGSYFWHVIGVYDKKKNDSSVPSICFRVLVPFMLPDRHTVTDYRNRNCWCTWTASVLSQWVTSYHCVGYCNINRLWPKSVTACPSDEFVYNLCLIVTVVTHTHTHTHTHIHSWDAVLSGERGYHCKFTSWPNNKSGWNFGCLKRGSCLSVAFHDERIILIFWAQIRLKDGQS